MSKQDLATRRSNLSEAKRALLEKLLRGKAAGAIEAPSIPPRPERGRAPLSFSQRRLWFLDKLVPGNPFYIIPAVVRLTGHLDVAALERSFNKVVARHEVLRTSFVTVDGQPVQMIAPALTLSISVVDLSGVDDSEAEAARFTAREAQQPFDLGQESLMRVKLLRLAEDDHILLLMMHHIISDEWSIGVLLTEIGVLYEAFMTGRSPMLSDLPVQYGDFAAWQQEWLQEEAFQKQLSYWRQQLEGIPTVLDLPTDRRRPPVPSFRGGKQWLSLSSSLTESLKQLSDKQGATLFMTLLATFATLLHRYTAQQDIVVGSPIANRNQSEIKGLIGCFINTLVLRADLSGDPTFSDLLRRVKEVALGAYANQDLPFEKIVEELQPERDLSRNPLFNVMLVFQNVPMPALELPGLSLKPVDVHNDTAKLDLALSISETATGLVGYFEYSKDLFDDATISRMISHFQILLEAVVADPHRPISTLPLLTESERESLIDWNNTGADFPRDKCIHHLFEEQAARTPHEVALVCEQQQLTYQELDRRTNQLANYLRGLGVGPEVLVGICVERSLDMIVGLLGILKAGGAYLPLDPEYPKERLAFMFEDAEVKVLMTHKGLIEALPQIEMPVVRLDSDWPSVARQSAVNKSGGQSASSLAYVIYTSGSTGLPKGVEVQHASVSNLIAWHQHVYGITADDRTTQVARLAFDASTWELWPYLVSGATLHIVDKETLAEPSKIVEFLAANNITVTYLPTPLAEAVLDEKWPRGIRLRLLHTGGDKLRKHPDDGLPFRLVNNYGPTENTVVATSAPLAPTPRADVAPHIGRPVSNTQVYLLDAHLQPVPIGVAGELYIGGDGLARGYRRRPALTAEKFIPNPFSKQPEARLYRTGDLARYLPDGNIEYQRRVDQQVKLRGFRIELGEIEAVLESHPAVEQAIVMVRESLPGENRLVGYLVSKDEAEIAASEIRTYLKEKLPEYMVPSAFVRMDRMPVTANGKIDRRALPEPDSMRPELSQAFVPPVEKKEKLLADIWMEFLGLKQVGIHDNFFELGGDSILSIQVVARANQAGLRLTPRYIFQHQTIAELAAAAATEAIEAEQERVSGEVMLTPIQRWFFEQDLAEPYYFNQAVLLEARQSLDQAALSEALEQLIDHHDALRLRFERQAEGWKQTNAEAENHQALTQFDLSHLTEEEQRLAINTAASDLQSSLNLAEGPLVRAALFDLGSGKPARLLMVIHHLAVDAVSWRILLEDLQTAYHQITGGDAVALPPKTTSFKQWALLLNEYAQSDELKQELGYWLNLLDRQLPALPVDYPNGLNTVASTEVVAVELSRQQTQALLQEVPEAYHTQINEVLLAGLALAYGKWSGERELLIDMEGHGREEIGEEVDLTRTVGWFTTIYPVVVEVREGEAETETLKRVKEEVRKIPKRGIGYGVLRYLTADEQIKRQMRSLRQAEISFNYLGQLDQSMAGSTLFSLGRQPDSPARSPQGRRAHIIEIDCGVAQGKLNIQLTFSRNLYGRESVEQLADCFTDALNSLVAQCRSQASTAYSASDFPLAGLDQENLNRLAASYRQIEDIYPLSPMQQGMLFHSLYEPGSDIYVTQMSCELTGDLELEALCWAWQRVIDRHTILRTAVEWEQVDEPLQVVIGRAELSIEQQDWRGIGEDEQRQKLEEYLREGRSRGFDFRQPPLMRVGLMRVADNKHYFVWEHHHLLLDGWSTAALMQEVFSCYESRTRGEQVGLDRRRPYRDYIQWVMRQDQNKAQQYWQRELGGVKAAAKLGVEISGGKNSRQGYTQQALRLSEQQSRKLNRFARQQQVTLNTILQGCWAVLMSRYSQQQEVIYGVTVSGRGMALEGVEQMIGLMINTLPMRVEVPTNQQVGEWLRAIQQKQVEQREYEYSSLWQVQGWSGAEAGERLFESILVFENYPVEAGLKKQLEEGARLAVSNVRSVEETNYGLTVAVLPGRELSIEIGYERQRYDEAVIRRMLRHMEVLLNALAADPHQIVSHLPLMTHAERRQLLVGFNHTSRPFPADKCVHQLFQRQVELNPQATAVVSDQQEITYEELNERANQLARHLRSLSVAPEQVVAICLDSSLEMVVSMLAVSKAGAIYLPLDPSNPSHRLAFMLDDTRARVVITQNRFLLLLPDHVTSICLDTDFAEISLHSQQNLDNLATADNAVYVVYTSGSTGLPKGIVVEHRSLVNECLAFASHHGLQAGDRLLQFASVGFDVAAEEVFSPLISGSTIVVGHNKSVESIEELLDRCDRQALSVLNLPSAYWHEWVSQMTAGEVKMPERLRLVIVGNERVSPERYEVWNRVVAGKIEWKNAYGPTEATITTTIFRGSDGEVRGSVPIGRPIANAEVYILDERLEPVPVGVAGEMYIGGAGVARGYLNRAELTA
ncbi:MAG TPA: amino acid adenylation domain-containing protein, partial [Blastocatellia bacterium]|nr:amino acid adenylation domain-containing protein [Blastocatellia bacterium]